MNLKHYIFTVLVIVFVFIAAVALAEKPDGSVYIDGVKSQIGLILAHGRGKHPTWKVVDPVRKGIHKKLGYHTLSLQMPNADKNYLEFASDFPKAYSIIKEGVRFLIEERGVRKVFIFGHSMGARMISSFMSENPELSISGIIVAGCRNNGGNPLSCIESLRGVRVPVLDLWGSKNRKDVDAANERKNMASETYTQMVIIGANHRFDGYEAEIVSGVVDWLKAQ